MKIQHIRTIPGPNVYHHKPVLIMTLDLGDLSELSSADLEGFTDRLLALLPGLHEHRCSPGYRGGFVERLNRGTYLAHIIEHIALELSGLAGIQVGYGKTIYAGRKGLYQIVVRYRSEKGMKALLKSAVELTEAVIAQTPYDLIVAIARAKRLWEREQLGPSTQAIIQAAEKKNIPWRRLNSQNLIQLGYGVNRKLIQATTSSQTSDIAVDIAQDKNLTKKFLSEARIPVPRGELVTSLEEAKSVFQSLGAPVVVKPFDSNHGNGVALNIETEAELGAAFEVAQRYSDAVLVEEQFIGLDYRLILVNGKLVAAARREPAHIIGDGVSSIAKLIEEENRNPLRGDGHEKPLTKISIDEDSRLFLARARVQLSDVPELGEIVYLRETANLSTGGVAIDVTDEVHPEIRSLAERAARVIGLDICGLDLITNDITEPLAKSHEGIIEVNAGPGIRMHHYPSRGTVRDVGTEIIKSLYPGDQNGRIPIISITGTNGKTTVTRLITHMLALQKKFVGMTTSDAIEIDGLLVHQGDNTGPASAHVVLNDPAIEVAVLETARGGLLRRGLGFDWCDIGVITNIQPDHIGQDGIESLDDVFRIKSLIAERVRPGGSLILNFDDPYLRNLGQKLERIQEGVDVIFFSMNPNEPELLNHIGSGKTAYIHRDGHLWEVKSNVTKYITSAALVPMTFGGTARFQIINALTGIAAARAYGLAISDISVALETFVPAGKNKGRVNLYRVKQGYVLLDYGHNPRAIEAVAEMAAQWGASRKTAVIAAPGDRSDDVIRMSGIAAAKGFDRLIIREDEDLRGRAPGETAKILCDAAQEINDSISCELVLNSIEALERAIHEMKDRELVVFFYEDLQETLVVLKRFEAEQATDFTGARSKARQRPSQSQVIPPPMARPESEKRV